MSGDANLRERMCGGGGEKEGRMRGGGKALVVWLYYGLRCMYTCTYVCSL